MTAREFCSGGEQWQLDRNARKGKRTAKCVSGHIRAVESRISVDSGAICPLSRLITGRSFNP